MTIRKQQLQSLLITSEIRDVVLTVQGAEDGHVLPEGRTQCRNEERGDEQSERMKKKEREREKEWVVMGLRSIPDDVAVRAVWREGQEKVHSSDNLRTKENDAAKY